MVQYVIKVLSLGDDDMDIGLLRKDYVRFIALCKRELSSKFQLITMEIENYGLPYAKIQMKGTVFQERDAPSIECGNGIFIDVFPIDRIPDSKIVQKLHEIISILLRYALLRKCKYGNLGIGRGLEKFLADIFTASFSKEKLVRMMEKVASLNNYKNTKCYMNSGSAYVYGKEVFPAETLEGELPTVLFEGELFTCPKDKEKILMILYGDYLKLPPEEKRYNRHSIVAIDFGDD